MVCQIVSIFYSLYLLSYNYFSFSISRLYSSFFTFLHLLPLIEHAGTIDVEVRTWRPQGDLKSKMREYFMGSAVRLKDCSFAEVCKYGTCSYVLFCFVFLLNFLTIYYVDSIVYHFDLLNYILRHFIYFHSM